MGKTILSLSSVMFLVFSSLGAQASKTYCNNRFGFCLDYPASLKVPDEGPINGDGITLAAENGIRISVSGSYNLMDWTPEAVYGFTREGLAADAGAEVAIQEAETTDTGFEALFLAGTSCQYARMLSQGNVYLVLTITGPKELKDDIVRTKEQLVLSFSHPAEGR